MVSIRMDEIPRVISEATEVGECIGFCAPLALHALC